MERIPELLKNARITPAAHRAAGGEKDIAVHLVANEHAVPNIEKPGMKKADDVMRYSRIGRTAFTLK